ncbi:PKD domain-containing protein [Flavihumibacter solisilvae]|uniref:PKD domain-containing protein n=1 Tax=Flavihumibacter solisilvae TaxID=1349421 RepID=A0A0C1IJD0_9BACT|nr:heparin lyase I family protein [Flavihumibacter solisilvae]KIC94305.1 hypothetical protein OI18_11760 [Flavihumibacter solisilvae]
MTKPAPQKLAGRIIAFAVLMGSGIIAKAQTGVVLQSSFESSNLLTGGFQVKEGCCSYSMTQSTAQKRSGSSSMRVELRKSDPDAQYGGKRAELTHNNSSSQSGINANLRWWKFSAFLPKASYSVDQVPEAIVQWHDKNPNTSTSPPLSLQVVNGRWTINIRYSLTNYTTNPNYVDKVYDMGAVAYDTWNDWVFYYDPQYTSNGRVKAWHNGKLVMDYTGPCHINGSWFPYFKVGIYKWIWSGGNYQGKLSTSTLRAFYIDDVKIADKTATEASMVGTTSSTGQAPVANAGSDVNVTLPTNSANLTGSLSKDPDGSISTYRWSQVSGPSTSTIGTATTVGTKVSNLVKGVYVYRLTVTDNSGNTDTDDVTVNVSTTTSTTNQAPTVSAGTAKTLTLPTNAVSLAGTASDADGSIASYRWAQASGPSTATFSSTTAATVTVSKLVAGTYAFRLTATDNKGATAASNVSVVVKASGGNQLPVVDAGVAKTVTLPTNTVQLVSTSSDPDGTIAKYVWSQVSGPNKATFNNTAWKAPILSNLVAGTYQFKLTVTDDKGGVSSDVTTVTVKAATSTASTLTVNPSPVYTTMTMTLNNSLTGSATVSIYSSTGTRVHYSSISKTGTTFSKSYNLSTLPAGYYTLSVYFANKPAITKKFQVL